MFCKIDFKPDIIYKAQISCKLWQMVKSLDCLGFDYTIQAFKAIVQHTDFASRWDIQSPADVHKLEAWASRYRKYFNIKTII